MLEDLFNPSAIAVIGAAREEDKVGHIIFDNIRTQGFKGKLIPVNPKAKTIHGIKCYQTVLDIPVDIDLAVIVTSSKIVPSIIEQCADKIINNVIIISAGFKESSIEGAELEREILKIAADNNIRVLGPNCLGIINTQKSLNASFAKQMPVKGGIAFVSQSGALGTSVLDWAVENNVGFSKFISLGNKSDLNEIDFLRYLTDDDETKVIALYLEGISNGTEFTNFARSATKIKPIVAIKAGSTEAGARAVSSHTGSLAGSKNAYFAAFKQAGIIQAFSVEKLFDFATALATQPEVKGNRLAILTNAGGPAIMASDDTAKYNLRLTGFNKKTTDLLQKKLPPASNVYNPVDVLGDALSDRYKYAADILMQDKNVDMMTVILTPQAMTEVSRTAEIMVKTQKKYKKPIIPIFMGGHEIEAANKVFAEEGLINYEYPERGIAAAGALSSYWNIKKKAKSTEPYFPVNKKKVKKIINETRLNNQVSIDFLDSAQILKEYGIKVAKSNLARTASEAQKTAGKIGYPVVLKIASADILHKTDIGGVKLGIENDNQIISAYNDIMVNVKKYMPEARIDGVIVQKMLPKGIEVIIGMSRDPQFGPLIAFGLGGIYVEIIKDVSFRIAPLTRKDARNMITEIKSYPLLQGFRGEPPADSEAIEDTILRISKLSIDFDELVELDINPLMVYGRGKGVISGDIRMSIR